MVKIRPNASIFITKNIINFILEMERRVLLFWYIKYMFVLMLLYVYLLQF